MAHVVIHEGPGWPNAELFVYSTDEQGVAEEFREDCGREGDPTSQIVEMSDDIDWDALEDVVPFLDAVKAFYDARPDNKDWPSQWGEFPEGFSRQALHRLKPHIKEIVMAITDFKEREVLEF